MRKILFWESLANNAPTTANTTAGMTMYKMFLGLTSPFLKCYANATKHIGKKLIRLMPWMVFCSKSKKESNGTSTVPPPMPIPPIMPAKNPNRISRKMFIVPQNFDSRVLFWFVDMCGQPRTSVPTMELLQVSKANGNLRADME